MRKVYGRVSLDRRVCSECGEPYFVTKTNPYCCSPQKSDSEFLVVVPPNLRRRGTSKKTALRVAQRDKFTCQYCGEIYGADPTREWHIDHFQPFIAGGSNRIENLLFSCAPCNLTKSDYIFLHIDQAREYIARERKIDVYRPDSAVREIPQK